MIIIINIVVTRRNSWFTWAACLELVWVRTVQTVSLSRGPGHISTSVQPVQTIVQDCFGTKRSDIPFSKCGLLIKKTNKKTPVQMTQTTGRRCSGPSRFLQGIRSHARTTLVYVGLPKDFFSSSFFLIGYQRCTSGMNTRPQPSQLAEPLWTDPGVKSWISVRELISTLNRKAQAGNASPNPSRQILAARKKPPPLLVQFVFTAVDS